MPEFEARRVRVIGVSPDDAEALRRFDDKYRLGFPLLADPERSLIQALGLWVEKTNYGKKYMGVERTTYMLDEAGVICRAWRKVKPDGHASEVLASLATA